MHKHPNTKLKIKNTVWGARSGVIYILELTCAILAQPESGRKRAVTSTAVLKISKALHFSTEYLRLLLKVVAPRGLRPSWVASWEAAKADVFQLKSAETNEKPLKKLAKPLKIIENH